MQASVVDITMLLWNYVTVGNAILAVLFLYLLNLAIVLYEFRGMPPGPILYSIPVIGNILSMGTKGVSLREKTQRLECFFLSLFFLFSIGVFSIFCLSLVHVILQLTSDDCDERQSCQSQFYILQIFCVPRTVSRSLRSTVDRALYNCAPNLRNRLPAFLSS